MIRVLYLDWHSPRATETTSALRSAGVAVTHVADPSSVTDESDVDLDAVDVVVCERLPGDADLSDLLERDDWAASLPVCCFTADGDESFAGRTVAAGADAYVPRADGVAMLVERVEDVASDANPSAEPGPARAGPPDGRIEDLGGERLLSAIDDGVYALDADGCYTAVNDRFVEMTGYTREELLGNHCSLVIADEDVERGRAFIREMLANDELVTTYRNTVTRKDGETVPVETSLSLLPMPDGEFVGTVGAIRDVSERVRFERTVQAERDRFATLFENVPDPVVHVYIDDDGPQITDVNAAFETVFGYDAGDVVGECLTDHVVPADRYAEAKRFEDRVADGETVQAEVRRSTASGIRDFDLLVLPVDVDQEPVESDLLSTADAALDELDPDAPEAFAIYTDVTDRKQRRQRVEVLNRVLRHDLRNGMNIIRGYAETLDDAGSEETAAAIRERADELLALAEKTRDVQQTLAAGASASAPADLTDRIETVVDEIRATFPAATLEVTTPPAAVARGGELAATAVRHLVENAIEHSDRPTPRVDIVVGCDGETVTVTVADDGPGIPAAERELFEDDADITQLRHASGLGLWLVNWVVTHAGGEVTFGENDPRGTVVTLTLPQDDPERPEASAG